MITSFKDLGVYKESYELAIIVNKLCQKLPMYEKNDLGSQLRRCSKSPPANIAEGWAKRRFEKEFKVHLDKSLGSCNEMEVHLSMARDLGFINKDVCNGLITRYIALGGKITNLRNNWKTY
ncbi:MAG: four helix bundle protein [Candidatus Blackburnbacteria bacterium]|nr:four helix bundle protein [Candidatus Blackburnbacteria bacterium]